MNRPKALYEKYRPATWAEVVGQDKAIKRIDAIRARGLAGRAIWLTGKSGTGKTTIARLLAREVACDMATTEITGRELSVGVLRELSTHWRHVAPGDGGWALVVEEAHGLGKASVELLLKLVEDAARGEIDVLFVFSTTVEGDTLFEDSQLDAVPFGSRCLAVPLSRQGLCRPFAERAKMIAEREGLDGQPLQKYERMAKDNGNNLRAMLVEIESGAMLT